MFAHAFCFSILLLFLCAPCGFANMGRISDGGSARLLSNASTVTMESEVINISVGNELIKGDCLFKFVNRGTKCTVRMGFPDQVNKWKEKHDGAVGGFLSFKTYVDGAEVETKFVPTEGPEGLHPYSSWHACEVTFEDNGAREIRTVFTTRPGLRPVSEKYAAKLVTYTLHTGASWNQPITNSVVNFYFEEEATPPPLNFVDVHSLPDSDFCALNWKKATKGTAVYESAKSPQIQGSTLRFEFTNFKPTKRDDLFILYGRMNRREADRFDEMVSAEEAAHYQE